LPELPIQRKYTTDPIEGLFYFCNQTVLYSPSSSLPDTPSPTHFDSKTHSKTTVKSAPININLKACRKERAFSEDVANERLSFSELWAGPTYSNSPPPSSLLIPKFSLRPKRTMLLDFPRSVPEMIKTHHPMAKSAPPSLAREHQGSTNEIMARFLFWFFLCALRRTRKTISAFRTRNSVRGGGRGSRGGFAAKRRRLFGGFFYFLFLLL
jgi:hypothetical protein